MGTAALVARGLTVTFGPVTALHDVSVEAAAGEMLCVTGPSGAGKTTLMHVLAGVQPPDTGEVTVGGKPVAKAAPLELALIPQTYGLSPTLTALESISLPLQAADVDRREIERRSRESLAIVGLDRCASRLTGALSGGQQQRVAVARALACGSGTLLADEPTSELDAENRSLILRLLRERADAGAVVVIASDDPQVTTACNKTVALLDGSIDSGEQPTSGG